MPVIYCLWRHPYVERMWTYFLNTSKSREWFSLGMEGFSLGGTKELRRVTQGTSMIPIVFHALRKKKKNWKQTLLKLSPLSRWQIDVCYFALYTVVLKFLIIEEREMKWVSLTHGKERLRRWEGAEGWTVVIRAGEVGMSESRGVWSTRVAQSEWGTLLGAEGPCSWEALLFSSLTLSPPWPAHQEPIYRAKFKYRCDLALIIYFSQLERVHVTQRLTRRGKGALCHSAR